MTYPTLSVQVAFDDDPLATSWTWTDITAHVRKIRTKIGREKELDDFDPGKATLVLDNTDRLFDPEHAAGTYFGKLLPSRRIRIRATHDAVVYTLFHGFVDDWPQDYGQGDLSEITVSCTDAFGQVARATLPSSAYVAEVEADTPWSWFRLNERPNSTTWADSSGNGRDGTTDLFIPDGVIRDIPLVRDPGAVSAANGAPGSGGGYANLDITAARNVEPPMSFEFWALTPDYSGSADNHQSVIFGPSWPSGVTIALGSSTSSARFRKVQVYANETTDYVRTTSNVVNDGGIHHVVVRCSGAGVWSIFVDGVAQLTSTAGTVPMWDDTNASAFLGSASATIISGLYAHRDVEWLIGEVAFYDSLLSSGRILAHYQAGVDPWAGDMVGERIDRVLDAIGWPAGLRDIATGTTELGPADLDPRNALAYMKKTANAEQGQLFCDMANSGKVTYLDRDERLTATRSTTVQYVFSDEDTSGVVHYETIDLKRDGRDVINSVTVTWSGGETTVIDQDSIDLYGLKSLPVSTEVGTLTEAENLGRWIIGRYAAPVARCKSLDLHCTGNPAAFEAALDSRINDRATVRKHPGGVGDPIELDVIVEGIEHVIDSGVNTWTTTLRTSQADAGPWFVWDTAEWDTTTRWTW